jgi:hypothetical protein
MCEGGGRSLARARWEAVRRWAPTVTARVASLVVRGKEGTWPVTN